MTRSWSRDLLPGMVVFVLVDAAFLVTDLRWPGELAWTADWAQGGLFIAGAVLAGVVALSASQVLSPAALGVTTGGDGRAQARALGGLVARTSGWALVAHALVLVLALGITAAARPTDSLDVPYLLTAILPIVFYCAVGALAGALTSNRVVAALLAVGVVILVSYLGLFDVLPRALEVGGDIGTRVGWQYDWRVLIAKQVVVLVYVLGLLVSAWLVVRDRRAAAAWTGVATLVAAVLAGSVLSANDPRFVPRPDPVPALCSEGEPTVCLLEGHTRALDTFAEQLRDMLAPLVAVGADLPDRYEEPQPHGPLPPGIGAISVLNSGTLNSGAYTAEDLARAAAQPEDCPSLYGEVPPDALMEAQTELRAWLEYRATGQVPWWVEESRQPELIAKTDTEVLALYNHVLACGEPAGGAP